MHRSRPSKALVVGALALIGLGVAHARPQVSSVDPREHRSFNDSIHDDTPSFSNPAVGGGKKVFGELPPATFSGENPKIKLHHGEHGHDLGDAFDVTKPHDNKHGHDAVAPVAAVPEPSTYVMLAVGLAGVALFGRRRRRSGR